MTSTDAVRDILIYLAANVGILCTLALVYGRLLPLERNGRPVTLSLTSGLAFALAGSALTMYQPPAALAGIDAGLIAAALCGPAAGAGAAVLAGALGGALRWAAVDPTAASAFAAAALFGALLARWRMMANDVSWSAASVVAAALTLTVALVDTRAHPAPYEQAVLIMGVLASALLVAALFRHERQRHNLISSLAIRVDTDTLTGLGSRANTLAALDATMTAARAHAETCALLYVDLDRFKDINDRFGHPRGDAVLKAAAGALRDATRNGDAVGRLGGEEFLVVLRGCPRNNALQAAERIRTRIAGIDTQALGLDRPVTASIGVAAHPGDGDDAEDLLERADAACLAAKRAGRNRIIDASDMPDETPAARPHRVANTLSLLLGGLLALTALLSPTPAESAARAGSDLVDVRLVTQDLRADHPAGLALDLAQGWHTYWRDPGKTGYPPRIDWSASRNLADAKLAFPVPERFTAPGGEASIGYSDRVTFPVAVTPADPAEPVELVARVDLLLCKTVCVPESFELSATVPPSGARASAEIARAAARLPVPAAALQARLTATADSSRLTLQLDDARDWTRPTAFLDAGGAWAFGTPHAERTATGWRIEVPARARAGSASLRADPPAVVVTDGTRALAARPEIRAQASRGGLGAVAAMLPLALLGGLILNLMPCVLPVLSLKLMAAVQTRGADRRRVRTGFLASAAGIFLAFGLLTAAAIGLKLSGAQVGWGMQFQSPVFLAVLTCLVTLFAISTAGLLEIRLPAFLSDRMARPGSTGRLGGQVMTGFAATVLATPCSAPLLGTAVGFALARGPVEIALIFAGVATGFAAPYLLVAAVPSAVRLLPRPGVWMLRLKQAMALALAGTAVWLAFLLLQASAWAPWALLLLCLLAVLPAVLGEYRSVGPRATAGAFAGGLGALALAFLLAWPGGGTETAPSWTTYSPERVEAALARGETVVIDVTADWCVTCQANKASAWGQTPVTRRLAEPGVTALRADWTAPDPRIDALLRRHGRAGIPFTLVRGPQNPGGTVLDELLTPQAVVEAIQRAAGARADRAG